MPPFHPSRLSSNRQHPLQLCGLRRRLFRLHRSLRLLPWHSSRPPQFIKLFTHQFSSTVLSRLNLLPFIKTNPSSKAYIVFRIDKTMYGLKEAEKISNLRLVSLLSSFGFYETSTPCFCNHVSRSILFVLVVDDFGGKYSLRSDFDFLVSCLSTLYHAKAHPIASKFLGFSVSLTTAPQKPSPSLTPASPLTSSLVCVGK